MIKNKNFSNNQIYLLYFILLFSLFIRLAFLLNGAELYYGPGDNKYLNNDSFSYTNSFLNLINTGHYTHNPDNPEASYGRLPGYPLFWGIHYLIFGQEHVKVAVAVTQILLDCLAVYLIFGIISTIIKSRTAPYIGAFLYACYPFIIIWTTIQGTEALASFLTILFFYCLFCLKPGKKKILLVAICLAMCFYFREYLGILIVSAFIFFYFEGNFISFIKSSFALGILFFLFYIPWPIRNYLHSHQIILIKTTTAGYDRYAVDVNSCRSWIYCWTPDADTYLNQIASSTEPITIPGGILETDSDKRLFANLVGKSRTCGSGFYNWKTNTTFKDRNCNEDIEAGFKQLKDNYIENNPISYFTKVPLLNFKKAFFKNELTTLNLNQGSFSIKSAVSPILFGFRSVLLILGLWGSLLYYKDKKIKSLFFFFGFIYLFICFILRQVEMRYLLQADVILIIPAALLLDKLLPKSWSS